MSDSIDELLNRPAFARGGKKELRQEVDVEILNVLDAVSLARDMPRAELVNTILRDYIQLRLREATLIQRLAGRNPMVADSVGAAG